MKKVRRVTMKKIQMLLWIKIQVTMEWMAKMMLMMKIQIAKVLIHHHHMAIIQQSRHQLHHLLFDQQMKQVRVVQHHRFHHHHHHQQQKKHLQTNKPTNNSSNMHNNFSLFHRMNTKCLKRLNVLLQVFIPKQRNQHSVPSWLQLI